MVVEPKHECGLRLEAPQAALRRAAGEGMSPAELQQLQEVVLGGKVDVFRRGMTGDPPAAVEPIRVR